MPRLLASSLLLVALTCALGRARAEEPAPEEEATPAHSGDEDETPRPAAVKETPAKPAEPKPECKVDDDCALGNICTDGACRSIRKQRRWIPPFYWANPEARDGYRYVPPFYFHSWRHTRDESYDTKVVPLLLYSRHSTPTQVADRVWPIIWHTRYLEHGRDVGSQTAMLPLFWWQERKGRSVGAVPLALTGWQRDPSRDLTEGLIAGIAYYRREKHNIWRVGFPLYWDHEQQGGRFSTLFPLFWYHRDGLASQSVFFPLLWRWQNEDAGTENLLVVPLFDVYKQRFGRRTLVTTPLGGYERDLDAGKTQFLSLAPPFYHRRDRDLELDVLLPIFARWRSHRTGAHGLYAGPLVHVGDDEGSTTTLFPLYWRFFDRRSRRETHILPFGGYHSAPGLRAAAAGPVFGWRSERGRGGWGGGLAPIFFIGRDEAKRHAMLLPLFSWWRDDDTGRQLTAVGPLYVRTNPPTHGFDVGLLPLLYFGHETGRGYGYLAPLLWFRKTPDRTTAVVGPAYYDKKSDGDWAGGLAPLLFFGRRGGERYDVALPLFYHLTGPQRSTTVVFPFVHDRRGEAITDTLLPLFYLKRAPHETLLATPIGGFHKNGGRAFGLIGPYIYKADAERGSSTHVLFPIAFAHRSPQYDLTAIVPLFWRVRNGAATDTVLFPLLWHRRGGQTDLDVVLPLFLRSRTAQATSYVVGPYFGRRSEHGWSHDGVLGLFSSGSKREGDKVSRFVGGPGFFYQRNDFTGVRRLLLGPVFDWRRPDGYTSGLFPLVFAWRRGTANYAVTPLYYHQADRATGLSVDVLGPIYWGRSNGALHLGLAPIFFGKYGRDGTSKTVLFPLVYFAKKPIGSTLVTPIGGYSSYEGGWKTMWGLIYARRDRLTSSQALWPIFYHGKNRLTGSTTTLAFPFYFDRDDHVDGVRVQAFTPLVWRYRTVEQTTLLALPFLAFDVNYKGESRTTGALPLFIRHRSEVSKSTWWTVPPLLMWGRDRHGEDNPGKDFVWFPLLWRFGGQERSTTVLFPLIWDFRRGDNRTTVFLLGAHWKRPDGDRTLVLNTFFRKGKNHEAGSWWFEFFPIVNFGRPRAKDWQWNLLEGLVGFSRQGRNRTLRLFWFVDIALQPVPRSNLSWWSSTPPEARTELF
jgi:hypothetical protein